MSPSCCRTVSLILDWCFLEVMLQHQQLHLLCVYQYYVCVQLVIRDVASLKDNIFLKLHSNNGFIWNLYCAHFFFQQVEYLSSTNHREYMKQHYVGIYGGRKAVNDVHMIHPKFPFLTRFISLCSFCLTGMLGCSSSHPCLRCRCQRLSHPAPV